MEHDTFKKFAKILKIKPKKLLRYAHENNKLPIEIHVHRQYGYWISKDGVHKNATSVSGYAHIERECFPGLESNNKAFVNLLIPLMDRKNISYLTDRDSIINYYPRNGLLDKSIPLEPVVFKLKEPLTITIKNLYVNEYDRSTWYRILPKELTKHLIKTDENSLIVNPDNVKNQTIAKPHTKSGTKLSDGRVEAIEQLLELCKEGAKHHKKYKYDSQSIDGGLMSMFAHLCAVETQLFSAEPKSYVRYWKGSISSDGQTMLNDKFKFCKKGGHPPKDYYKELSRLGKIHAPVDYHKNTVKK